jgi:perosamine synthetase
LKIPINAPIIEKDEINEVHAVLTEKSLTSAANAGGKRVQQFEDLLASYVKSRYAVAVNSGTAALQAALYALDIKQGDEVLIPSFTFVATANSVLSLGAKPVFVDIRPENYTMDPVDLKKKITKKSKAIMPVHLYGNFSYMDEISEIADKNNLDVIEDAC